MTDPNHDDATRVEARRGTGRDARRAVRHPAVTDELTGLPNKLHFDLVFEVVFEMGARGIPLCMVCFAIDRLDEYERDHGADETTEAVRDFGITIGATTRRMDLFAHLDEGRFVALLQDCNLQGGLVAAERMGDLVLDWSDRTGLTHSAGVVSWRQGMTEPREMWVLAESALEEARAAGGDRVEIAPV